ncbi:hypothetical protein Mgra_00003418 [Meloidogyne graminicola]|uniref:Uncharacterized protein n=1 Tax=Meloidogyne graminicola TaxID=189291 RepID=A0A8S9ZVF2_9BILA|nr:hypothetical protein Mgra_00003418 [Meloidogyne graminicola]
MFIKINLSNELLLEIINFIPFNIKWNNIRINKIFDLFIIKHLTEKCLDQFICSKCYNNGVITKSILCFKYSPPPYCLYFINNNNSLLLTDFIQYIPLRVKLINLNSIFNQIFEARLGPLVLELGQVFHGIEWPENQHLTGRNLLIEEYRDKYQILTTILTRCLNIIEQTQIIDFNVHFFYNFVGFGTAVKNLLNQTHLYINTNSNRHRRN